jgi:hypothetical protein
MYLISKAWISLLEGAGLNSIDFEKARLLVNIFEVSHGIYPAAYLSRLTFQLRLRLGLPMRLLHFSEKEYLSHWLRQIQKNTG